MRSDHDRSWYHRLFAGLRLGGITLTTAVAATTVALAGDPPLNGEFPFHDDLGTAGDNFATALALDGATALAGAPLAAIASTRPGAVVEFRRSGAIWTQAGLLTASDGMDADLFGASVQLSGTTAVIGAPRAAQGAAVDQGAAYVFQRTPASGQWNQRARLTAADGVAADEFGRSVSIDGDWIVAGSELVAVNGQTQRGAAYVFRRTPATGAWIQQAKLVAPDGQAGDRFGAGVAISGETVAIGSPGSDAAFADQGAVYVFQFDSNSGQWIWIGKLLAADGAPSDNLGSFATGVAIDGDLVVAGAVDHNSTGAAYVFRRRFISPVQIEWIQEAKLVAADGKATDQFGFSVSLAGGSALIGSPGADVGGLLDRGAGYYFTRSVSGQWRFRQKLVGANAEAFDNAARSTALGATAAMIGLPFASPAGSSNQGAAVAWACGDLIFADGGEDAGGCGL